MLQGLWQPSGKLFLSRLVPIDNARPLLLGNIANLFLDEWIHAGEEEPDYIDCMKKAFRQYPIELAACAELRDPSKEKEFAKDCRMHFEHIRDVVQHTFLEPGYNLDKKEAVLEPSYICEALGIQGRLDYMQRDMSSFIEMKSGKADEFSMQGKVEPKENNKVQMLLYMAVLEYSMGQDRRRMHPYLLYTRYPLLYPARASWAQVRRVINLRNRIVAAEYGVQFHNHPDFTRNLLAQINPEVVNERKLSGRFWEQYLKPSISRFREKLSALEPLEQAYFYTLYNFITKELYTSKSGDVDYEGRAGASALWLSTLDEKREAGEILYDLQIMEIGHHRLIRPIYFCLFRNMMKCFFPISVQEMWLCCMSVIMTWIMRPIKWFLRVILSRLQIQNCVFVYVLPNVMLPFFSGQSLCCRT